MRITRVLALIGIGGAFLMILPGCSAPHPTPVATPSPVAPLPVAQTPDPPEQADPLIQKMQALAAAPEHEATGAALKLRAISHPQDAEAQAELAIFAMVNNEGLQTRAAAERAAALGTHESIIYYLLSSYYRDKQQTEKAADLAQRMVEVAPQNPYSYYTLARADLRMGELRDCIAALTECTRLAPGFSEAYRLLGNAYFLRAEFANAEQALRKSVDLDATNAMAWNGLGNVYLAVGNREQAEDAFQHAVKLAPDHAAPYVGLGRAYLLRPVTPDNNAEALQILSRAVTLDPTNSDAQFSLGELYRRQDKLPEATQAYQKALQHNAHASNIRYALGQVLRQQGKEQEATRVLAPLKSADWTRRAQFLQHQIDFLPDKADVRYELGTLYMQQKQYAEALHQFQMLAHLEPGQPRAHRAIAQLFAQLGHGQVADQERALAAPAQSKP